MTRGQSRRTNRGSRIWALILAYGLVATQLTAVAGQPASAASPSGTEFRVNNANTEPQYTRKNGSRSVAMTNGGNSVVTWWSEAQDADGTNQHNVYVRTFDSAGSPTSGEIRANNDQTSDQDSSSVGMDSAGNFVVSWAHRPGGATDEIYARVFNSAGLPQTGDLPINQTSTGTQAEPSIAVAPNGDFVVVWHGEGPGDTDGIFARRYNANGTPKAGEFLVNTTTPGAQLNPVAATDSVGNFIVVWDGAGVGDGDGVFARRVNNDGTFLDAAEFLVNTASGVVQQEASVDMDTNGDFVVTWTHSGTPKTVHAKAYNPALGSPGQFLVPTGGGEHSRPSVSMADTGAFSISWQTNPGDADGWGINLRDYLAVGSPAGPQVLVNTSTALSQKRAGVAVAPNGNTSIVIWEGNGTQTGHVDDQGVFAQIFSPDYAGPTYYTVDNTNTSGAGSLAAAVAAANSACPASPVIEYNIPTGDGGYDSGRNVWTINGSGLHTITCDNTVVDGYSQETNQGIANGAGPFGTGGTVGLDLLPLAQVDAPEVELQNTRFAVQANNVTIQGLAFFANPIADINVISGSGTVIQNNILGDDAVYSTSSPAVARQSDRGVVVNGGDGTIRNNLAVHHKNDGLETTAGGSWLIEGNEVRNNGLNGSLDDGIVLRNVTGTVQGNLVHFESDDGVRANAGFVGTIISNTLASIPDDGLVVEGGMGAEVTRNIFQNNGSNGVEVRQNSDNFRISDNSFLNNGGLSIELVPGAGGDNLPLPNTAVPPACGLDGVGVGNQGLDKPIIASAVTGGAVSSVAGQSCAGARVEVYKVANSDGFGEGSQLIGSTTADGVTGDWSVGGITGLVLGDEVTALAIQFPADSNSRTSEMAANATLVGGTASIGDKVWFDSNRDGIWTSGENIDYSGVTVRLWSPGPDTILGTGDDILEATDTTDGSETYGFTGLAAGDYRVEVDESTLPDPYVNRTTYANPWDISLGNGESNTEIDFGYFDNSSSSSWRDVDPEGGVLPGEIITYYRSHTNTGPVPDTNVRFENPLPVGTTYVPGSTLVEVIPVPRYLDRLDAVHYNNSNSTGEFAEPWFENGEPTDHTSGDWQIAIDPTFNEAFRKGGAPGTSIERLVTTTAYNEGYFGYSYRRENVPAGVTFEAQISPNGLAGPWTTVGTVEGAGAGATDASRVNIPDVDVSAFMTGNTAIRFVHTAGVLPAGSYVYFDSVDIYVVGNPVFSGPGGAPPLLNTGVTLNEGEQLRVTFQVQVDDPTAETQVSSTATRRTDIWGDSTWPADINPIVSISADAGAIVINEVLFNETWGIDANDEFIELYNNGGSAIALDNWELASSGWGLDGDGYTFPVGTTLNPGEYAVIWSGPAGASQSAPGAVFEDWLGGNGDLDDPGDNLRLWDAAGDVVDFVAWGTGGPAPGHPSLWDDADQASLVTTVGQSMSLTPNGTNPNDSGCWEPTTSGDAAARCGGAPVTIDSVTGPLVWSAGAINNAPVAISGTVYDDALGFANPADFAGHQNVNIRIYRDNAPLGTRDAGDTALPVQATDPSGNFSIPVSAGSAYWVVAQSDGAGAWPTNVWPEQTFGSIGALCDNGAAGITTRVSAGPCYGGIAGDVSDQASTGLLASEHVVYVPTVSGAVSGVEFAFAQNIVTNTRAGDGADDSPAYVDRTVQGSMRQFIVNANNTPGQINMRFVPTEPTNQNGGVGIDWWRIPVSTDFEQITSDDVTIDGAAFSHLDGVTPLDDTNDADLGMAAAAGTTGTYTTPILDPELELIDAGSIINGLDLRADSIKVRNLAMSGFDYEVQLIGATNVEIDHNVLGTGPDSFTGTQNGVHAIQVGASSFFVNVHDNLIGFKGSRGVQSYNSSGDVTVEQNELRSFGADAVDFSLNSPGGQVIGNYITGAYQYGVDSIGANVDVIDNTITGNGVDPAPFQTGGIRVFSDDHIVQNNVVTNNIGDGIHVAGRNDGTGRPAATRTLVTGNVFGDNTDISIDLAAHNSDVDYGDSITANTGGTVVDHGNDGIDTPVITAADVAGNVSGTACANCSVEIYRAIPDTDGSDEVATVGYGEGIAPLATVVADGSGDWSATGLSLSAGWEVSAVTHVDTDVDLTLDSTSEFASNFAVTGAQTITGAVYNDFGADGSIAADPTLPNVGISLYQDDGDDIPNAADTLIASTTTSDPYNFGSLGPNVYWVAVDSRSVGLPATSWYEQTYGPIGGWCDTDSGTPIERAAIDGAGPCSAGLNHDRSDDLANLGLPGAEHIARIDLTGGGNATNVDFGFSVNVVTTTRGGDTTDDDGTNVNRSIQGSLRQFIQNANATAGPNAMRFVPVSPTNASSGLNNWWSILVTSSLPAASADGTTIDGSAFDYTDGTTPRPDNGAAIGSAVTPGLDGAFTTPVLDPELEIIGDRIGTPVRTGIYVTGDNVTVRDLAIYGFGDPDSIIDGDVHFAGANNGLATRLIVGSGPAAVVAPPAGAETHEIGIYATASSAATVSDSIVRFVADNGVMAGTSAVLTVQSTEFVGNGASSARSFLGSIVLNGVSIDQGGTFGGVWGSGVTVQDSTITNVATGARLTNSGSSITRSILTNNGNGVYVSSTTANQHLISENHFGSNSGQAILLLNASKTNSGTPLDCGYEVGTVGNDGIDLPVITSAVDSGASTTVTGTACANSRVEVYRATAGSGDTFVGIDYGEGTEYLGFTTADASGDWSYVDAALNFSDVISAIVIDGANNTSEFAANYAVTVNTASIDGTVYADWDGDGGIAADPQILGVDVRLFRDNGDDVPNAGDTPIATETTDGFNPFSFTGLSAGTYWVTVDSRFSTNYWYEQTYGPIGAWCDTDTGVAVERTAIDGAGPCYGGLNHDRSDDLANLGLPGAEHLARIDLAPAEAKTNVDFGLSSNVVTTLRGGDTADDDAGVFNRSVQGSLRQFIVNANNQPGTNVMRFVPVEPTNQTDGTNDWWQIPISDALPTISNAGTTVSGLLHDYTTGFASGNPNGAALGAGYNPGAPAGLSTPTLDPELEIRNVGSVSDGLYVFGGDSTTIERLAISGFNSDGIRLRGLSTDSLDDVNIWLNVIGSSPVSFTETAATENISTNISASFTDNLNVSQNLIGFGSTWGSLVIDSSTNAIVHRNEIKDPQEHGVWLFDNFGAVGAFGTSNSFVRFNLVTDARGGINIERGGSFNSVYQNTVTGSITGVRLGSTNNSVRHNEITANGTGILVSSPAVHADRNQISENSIHNNSGAGIDLLPDGVFAPNGITPNDGLYPVGTDAHDGVDKPIITAATISGANLIVDGYVGKDSARLAANWTIEVFQVDMVGDPGTGDSGLAEDSDLVAQRHGEGRWFVGSCVTSTVGAPNEFSCTVPLGTLGAGDYVTAVAIESAGQTSEFGTIAIVNNAPVFDADLPDRSDPEGAVISLSAAATDPNPDTLVYSATGLPPGLSIDTGTGLITGTITYTASGSYSTVLTVLDGNGGTDTDTFTWTVTEVNRPPVANDATFSIDEDAADNDPVGSVSASDPDLGDTLSYTITSGDTGGSFDIDTSGNITVVAPPGLDYETTTTYNLVVTVTDNGAPNRNDTAAITVNIGPINDNTPVANDDTGYTVAEGGSLDTSVSGDNPVLFNDTDADVPADTLTVTLVTPPTNDTAFALNSTTGHFTYTHDGTETTTDSFTYTVSDGTNTSLAATVTIAITGVNDPPVLDPIGAQGGDELVLVTFDADATDPELGVLTYTLADGPVDAVPAGALIDPVTGVFSWTPTEAEGPGVYEFYVVVTDNGAPNQADQELITFTITEVNAAPSVTNPGDQINDEADVVFLAVVASDVDLPANVLTYSATGLPLGLTINEVTGEITGTVSYTAAGSYSVEVTVTDNGTPTPQATMVPFTWTINDIVVPGVPLGITKVSDGGGSVLVGETIEYTITVTNTDSQPQTNFTVTDPIPAGTTYVPGSTTVDYPSSVLHTYRDEFNAQTYAETNGTEDWSTSPWVEVGEADGPSAGAWQVADDPPPASGPFGLLKTGNKNTGIARLVDLDPASYADASFSFKYRRSEMNPANTILVQVSTTGLAGPWTNLFIIDGGPGGVTDAAYVDSPVIDLRSYRSATTAIRFFHTGANDFGSGKFIMFDDIEVTAIERVPASAAGAAPPTLATGYDLYPGESITVTWQVTVDAPAAVSQVENTASVTTDQETTPATAGPVIDVVANRDPIAVDDGPGVGFSTVEDVVSYTTGNVLTNDSDPDSDPITVDSFDATSTGGGTVSYNGDGTFDYIPVGDWNGNDTFTYTLDDGRSGSATATVTIEVAAVNDDPVAVADGPYSVAEGATLNEPAITGVLANDTDIDVPADTLTTDLVTGPSNDSSFTLYADGSFDYTHDGTETTTDSFTYRVFDGTTYSNTVTATINITPVNDPPTAVDDPGVGTITVAEAGSIPITVLTNDSDPDDGLDITTVVASNGTYGTTSVNASGVVTYTHNGTENFADTFTYTVEDAAGQLSNVATVTINITPVNDPPTAVDDPGVGTITVAEAGSIPITVLTNDSDPDDGLDITTVVASNGTYGTTSVNASGVVTYTHNGTENFADTFTYTVEDAAGQLSNVATVTINITPVNDPPTAVDDPGVGTITVAEAGSIPITVLTNDSDPDDGLDITTVVASNGTYGTTSVNASGVVTYTHNGTENFADTFTYTVEDAAGQLSNVATVTINITPVNDPPTAVDDPGVGTITVAEAGSIPITVLTNDSDPDDGLDITTVVASNGTYGTTSVNASGVVTYTHNGTENFADTFTYTVEDAAGQLSNVATVTINITPVNDPPTAVDDPGVGTITVAEAGSIPITVLTNDSDPDDGLDITTVVASNGTYGTTSVNASGVVTYTHNGTENFADTFTYTVEDAAGQLSNVATVTINITPVNDPPVLTSIGAQSGDELVLLTFDADATDPELGVITYTLADGPTDAVPTGAIIDPLTGVFNWTPTEAQGPTTISFYVVATDNGSPTQVAQELVTFTINEVNIAPFAGDDVVPAFPEGSSMAMNVTVNDGDLDLPANTLTWSIVTPPAHASSFNFNATGLMNYTHDGSENFTDSFTYRVFDGTAFSPPATVSLSFTPVNDPPTAVDDPGTGTITAAEGGSVVVDVLANDSDPDNGIDVTSVVASNGTFGTTSVNPVTGAVTYTHNGTENFSDTFTYTVEDAAGQISNTATVTITITPVNDPPTAVDDPPSGIISVAEGGSVVIGVLANDSDIDGTLDLTSVVAADGTNGTTSVNAITGDITYTHNGSETTSDTFTYTVEDNLGLISNTATVTVSVTATNDPPVASDATFSIDEDAVDNDPVGTVSATDPDVADTLSYVISSGDPAGSFDIDAFGNITVVSPPGLDFETTTSYTLVVTVSDDGTPTLSDTATITVNVGPVNDNAPIGLPDILVVTEGGGGVVNVLANDTDPDLPNDFIRSFSMGVPPHASTTSSSIAGNFTYGHDDSENLTDVWIYRVVDAVGNQDIVTLNITILPVNDNTPIPADDGYTLAEGGSLDTSVTIDPTVLANDTDADAPGDTLNASLVSGTSNGVLSLATDGNFTYSHNGSEILTDSFTYEVFDGVNTSVAATVTLTMTPVNDNTPVATDDALIVLEGGSNSVDVKTTDSDLDLPNDTLTIVAVTNGTYGTATTDGTSVTYTHNGTENFADTLTYTLEDAAGQQDTAFVNITVTPVNDNPPVGVDDGPYSVLEAGTIDTIADVLPPTLANDTDLDTGDTLTASRELTDTGPTYGSLSFDAAGHFVYIHDGTENFTDSFTYTVTDAVGATDTATVTINISAVNEGGPTAVPDGPYTTNEGATINTVVDGLFGVLANDTDPDLPTDTLVASQELSDTGPSYGTLTLNTDGSFIYGHNGTENFTDSFTYTVTDDGGNIDTATVSITINPVNDNPPVANPDVLTVAESGAGSVNVKADDTDPDLPNDTLTIVSVTNGTHGTASTDGTSVSYTHGGTENFTDTVTYTLEDAAGQQDTAIVTITVTPVNDNTPVAVDDGPYGVAEGATLDTSITPDPTVLANDSDADLPGDTLTATLASPASHGTVVLSPNGDFTYDHDGTENFTDSFTYQVFDGTNTSAVATVSIAITPVNDNPPVANDDVVVGVPEGGTRNETGTPLLANDTDLDTGDTLTASRELTDTGPSHGTITVNPDGTFIYVHDDTENFTDSFTYTVTDAGGNTDQATVSITISPVNDNPPVALADSGFIVPESGFVTGSVATNDSDPDLPNDTLTFTVVTAPAFHASFTLLADGTFNYTHFGPFEGLSDTFTYQVEDAAGNTDTAPATITITPINDNTPSAADDGPYSLDEGATLDTLADSLDSVLVNDSDTDLPGDTLTAVVATPPAHGSLTLDPSGHFVYTHDGSENLADSFTYSVYDGANTSAPATVTLTINPINDSVPVASDDVVTADEGLAASVDVLANDTDPDLPSDSLSVTSVIAGTYGSATTDGTNVTYTHDGTENFSDTVTYTVTDAAGNTDTGTITVTINPTNDNGPTAIDDTATLDEASTTTIDVVANDTDADLPNDTLTVTAVVDGTFGLATTDGTNITYTHDGSENFSDTVQYTVTDDAGNAAVANLLVTITPTNDNAPVALDDGPFATDVAGSVAGSVLDNDTDTDGDAITAALATGPSAGTVTLNPNGTFSYTHDGSGALSDSFTYVANDGALDSTPATVSIGVNAAAPPVANPDGPFSVTQGSSVSGGSVLDNDSDPSGLPLSALIATGPSNGSLTLNPNGTFTYSHNGSDTTSDSFTYVARNATTSSDPTTVTIEIELLPDLAMIAVDDVATIDEDSELTIDLFANDNVGNGTSFNLISINDPINGTLEIVGGGTVKYLPRAEWSGTETLVYSSTNNEGQSAEGRLIINVVPINDPPVAEDDSTETEGAVTISLNGLVSDIDSSEFTFGIIEQPLNGTVEIVNGRATYIPDAGYAGSDSFVYRVFDDSFGTDSARIVIDVIPQDLSAFLTTLTPDLDRILAEPDPTPGGAAKIIAGFGSLDGVRLLFGEIFGHGNTFRIPVAFLIAVFLASLFIGLRSGFVLAGGPLFLAPVGVKNYAGVLKREDEQILAFEGPGERHGVVHRFEATEKGIRGTGRRADADGVLWIEVEAEEGDAWVDSTYLTIDISPGAFANDEDVDRLLSDTQAALGEADLSGVLGSRGLFVAHFAEPAHFDSEEVEEFLLAGVNFGFWDSTGETSHVRGDFTTMISGPVVHVMNNAGATAANDGLEMPTEFENFNRMTFANQITGARWSVIVEYTEDGPKLLGIWRAGELNPNSLPLAS